MTISGADLKLLGRVFLATAIPFGTCMALWFALSGQSPALGIAVGALAGLLFGVAMTLVIGTAHILSVRSAGGQTSGAKYARDFVVPMSTAQTFAACLRALESLPAKIRSRDDARFELEARTGVTMRSFGEIVRVTCEPLGPSETKVSITSVPRLATTLVDYGKGLENIDRVAAFLDASSADDQLA